MLHHISLGVSDIERSAAFYDAVLGALGYVRVFEDLRPGGTGQAVGYGRPGEDDKLSIKQAAASPASTMPRFHIAFAAPSREAVHNFHDQALKQGGRDNGPPGPRPSYGPHYHASFVLDPDGYRLEAVINTASEAAAATIGG